MGAAGAAGRRDQGFEMWFLGKHPPGKKILLSQNINADQMSLAFFFFFLHVSLTAGKNIGSNCSPQAHTFCLPPDKGI